jgi:hypothetical protein
MTIYIAELDETQKIATVWIKEKSARGPKVYDPQKHVFDATSATGFFGASQNDIATWIAAAQNASATSRYDREA